MALAVWNEEKTADAVEAGKKTKELLDTRGWCCWQCAALGGKIIVVIRDESITGYPAGYPVWTAAELRKIEDVDIARIRLIHEAKTIDATGGKVEARS